MTPGPRIGGGDSHHQDVAWGSPPHLHPRCQLQGDTGNRGGTRTSALPAEDTGKCSRGCRQSPRSRFPTPPVRDRPSCRRSGHTDACPASAHGHSKPWHWEKAPPTPQPGSPQCCPAYRSSSATAVPARRAKSGLARRKRRGRGKAIKKAARSYLSLKVRCIAQSIPIPYFAIVIAKKTMSVHISPSCSRLSMSSEAAASRCHGKRLLPNERRGRRGEEKSGGKKIKKK